MFPINLGKRKEQMDRGEQPFFGRFAHLNQKQEKRKTLTYNCSSWSDIFEVGMFGLKV